MGTSNRRTFVELVGAVSASGGSAVVWFCRSNNTADIAKRNVSATRAQAFEVVPQTPYPEAYDDCADLALQEA